MTRRVAALPQIAAYQAVEKPVLNILLFNKEYEIRSRKYSDLQ
jgi:hypothetical protein